MAYIDKTYYVDTFHGEEIADKEFLRLADVAADVVDSIVNVKIDLESLTEEELTLLKRANCYEVEYLYEQGGMDAVNGFMTGQLDSESLGDYSVSSGSMASASSSHGLSLHGIPIHALTLAMLQRAGLYSVWAYRGTVIDNGYP